MKGSKYFSRNSDSRSMYCSSICYTNLSGSEFTIDGLNTRHSLQAFVIVVGVIVFQEKSIQLFE
jgi:hypothetical protein